MGKMPWVINSLVGSVRWHRGSKKLYVRFEAGEDNIEISGTNPSKKKIVRVNEIVTILIRPPDFRPVEGPKSRRSNRRKWFHLNEFYGRR